MTNVGFKVKEDKLWHKFWPSDVPKNLDIPDNLSVDEMFRNTAKNNPDLSALFFVTIKS